ncbi:MAG TPA: ribonuclease P protein component [Candidatus Dormibacteraeota bacterium]|nr:ribonuclease P protein component [Candidatus Dormibacteraeota bacterium]
MRSEFRLRKSAEFERVRAERRVAADRLLRLQACPNLKGHPRIGITVSKRFGGAVQRNLVRRRLKAAAEVHLSSLSAVDLVLIPTPAGAAGSYAELARALAGGLDRLAVVRQ